MPTSGFFIYIHQNIIKSNKVQFDEAEDDFQIKIEQFQLRSTESETIIAQRNSTIQNQSIQLNNHENAEKELNLKIERLEVGLYKTVEFISILICLLENNYSK